VWSTTTIKTPGFLKSPDNTSVISPVRESTDRGDSPPAACDWRAACRGSARRWCSLSTPPTLPRRSSASRGSTSTQVWGSFLYREQSQSREVNLGWAPPRKLHASARLAGPERCGARGTGCNCLNIQYSNLSDVTVKYNNDRSYDFTNPGLPAGPTSHPQQALLDVNGRQLGPALLSGMPIGPPPEPRADASAPRARRRGTDPLCGG
jgi:hypothetical protein